MLGRVSRTLRKYANGWLVLLVFASLLPFNAFIFPGHQAKLKALSGGTGSIDPLVFYTPAIAYSRIASYGEMGRNSYRTFELTADLIYPVLYTLLFALLITWLFQRGFVPESSLQRLNVIPLGGWLFDLLENLSIVTMLTVYPATPTALAWVAGVFTLLKWLFAGAAALLILLGFVMAAKNGFRKHEMSPAKL